VLYWNRPRASAAEIYDMLDELEATSTIPLSVAAVTSGANVLAGSSSSSPQINQQNQASQGNPQQNASNASESKNSSDNSALERSSSLSIIGKSNMDSGFSQTNSYPSSTDATSDLKEHKSASQQDTYSAEHARLLTALAIAGENRYSTKM
jgi:hypothetical protein